LIQIAANSGCSKKPASIFEATSGRCAEIKNIMPARTRLTLHAKRIGPTLTPDRSRVLMRPFRPTTDDISRRIVARVMALPEEEVARLLGQVLGEFADRHEQVENIFRKRFAQVMIYLEPSAQPSPERQMLIGAYFTHEYSPESAALFNPSIVPHPDQSGLPKGALRFILSLRATGEGHISSITFRTGIVSAQHRITLAPAIEADSLPLQKSLVAKERLYTVLPLHAVWSEVADGRLQAARIVDSACQRTVAMALSKSKGPARAVTAVASRIVEIVDEMARAGMWRTGSALSPALSPPT